MYHDYQDAGEDFYSFVIGLQDPKSSFVTKVNQNPSWDCTEWLYDQSWQAYSNYYPMYNLGSVVPAHFIIDRDGYVRYGKTGSSGVPGNLQDCINELL